MDRLLDVIRGLVVVMGLVRHFRCVIIVLHIVVVVIGVVVIGIFIVVIGIIIIINAVVIVIVLLRQVTVIVLLLRGVVVVLTSLAVFLFRIRKTTHIKTFLRNRMSIVAIRLGPSNTLVVYVKVNVMSHHNIGTENTSIRLVKIKSSHILALAIVKLHVMLWRQRKNDIERIIWVQRLGQTHNILWILIQALVKLNVPSNLKQNGGVLIQLFFRQRDGFMIVLLPSHFFKCSLEDTSCLPGKVRIRRTTVNNNASRVERTFLQIQELHVQLGIRRDGRMTPTTLSQIHFANVYTEKAPTAVSLGGRKDERRLV
mmetsp:Transcript_13432/g.19768  ORF Transcript_13432/g.19768 Transcript_13432/m.19768 type:complete len:313 (-) Transcript_13432:1018-1956(-)